MEWSAPSTVGWGGTLRNVGVLSFSGATVSLGAAEDKAGLLAANAGPWPTIVNEEGAQVVFEEDSGVNLEWLLWNEGGSVAVRGWVDRKRACCDSWCGMAMKESELMLFERQ